MFPETFISCFLYFTLNTDCSLHDYYNEIVIFLLEILSTFNVHDLWRRSFSLMGLIGNRIRFGEKAFRIPRFSFQNILSYYLSASIFIHVF